MEIKGIEFNVNAASGALGWFGEGYWYHRVFKKLIPFFKKTTDNMSFVAKTTTVGSRLGNLPLRDDYTPRELFPECIKVYPFGGFMLNAVNLSGPGFKKLLSTGKWQKLDRPSFGLSFMPVGDTLEEMIQEANYFRYLVRKTIEEEGFDSPIWIQINISCPNTERGHRELISAATEILKEFQPIRQGYNLVIDLKVNLLMPNVVIREIWLKNLCDLITISNTIKYGTEGLDIKWRKLFWRRKNSPLEELGGGGLSGKPLFESVCKKIASIRRDNIGIPIKASGGICSRKRVRVIKACGANAIEFATAISLRPWRIYWMVREARKIFTD